MNQKKLLDVLRELRKELDEIPTPEERERMRKRILTAIAEYL